MRRSLARFVEHAAAMTTLPVTPLSAALGAVILETRFLEQRWPIESERASMRRALLELHKEVSTTLVLLDGSSPRDIDEHTASRAREAFLATLVLAVLLQRIVLRTRRGTQEARALLTSTAAAATTRLLDALDPFIARTDAALRRVMLEGVSSEHAAAQIALPV
jgi:hypothetical protein